VISDSCEQFKAILFPHQLERLDAFEQKVAIMVVTQRYFLVYVLLVDNLVQELI
jgi:hypothetical protein